MLSVMLVDDEPLIRRGLKKLIDWQLHGFRIVGEADNGEEALELVAREETDIVVTDLKMPAMNGLELSEALKARFPTLKVIVLTGYDDFPYVQQSIRNGVADYLLKPVNADALVRSLLQIRKQLEEERYRYPFDIEASLLDAVKAADAEAAAAAVHALFDELHKYKVPQEIVLRICDTVRLSLDRLLDQESSSLKDILRKNNLEKDEGRLPNAREELRADLLHIVSCLCDHRQGYANKRTIQAVIDDIERNFQQDITLGDLAAKFYLNASYLSQLFKSETGETFSNYVIKLRIEKAKRLLGDPNMKIQDISELVGYGDPKYFGQLFKRMTGMLPSEYRAGLTRSK
ncbi:response regulator [Cohnella sp. LGH]|uniref:response regulator n=1 Tax=Cohnella sp. LGH TaxID=1619153 RepID=UPI001ADC6F38|nr:response regulator [Cohnella sp. LGH]QTH42529.1 response regulator [Cohnella sp. LGH]